MNIESHFEEINFSFYFLINVLVNCTIEWKIYSCFKTQNFKGNDIA